MDVNYGVLSQQKKIQNVFYDLKWTTIYTGLDTALYKNLPLPFLLFCTSFKQI